MPALYIITGSNGAGKSTAGPRYLSPDVVRESPVFDGDKLFIEKRKELWKTIKSHKECANLAYEFVTETFDRLVETSIAADRDFAYEGHFTNEATWDIPRQFKAAGYRIHLVFFGLSDVELSEMRVAERSKSGGHYVDPMTVTDNFYGNLEKLSQHYRLFDTVQIIDTSETEHIALAMFNFGECTSAVPAKSLPNWVRNYLPEMALKIEKEEVGRELL